MFKLLLVTFVTLIAAIDACYLYGLGVSDSEQQIIVNKHNELRQMIANGEVDGQPKGVNLKTLKWDAALASSAQGAASACTYPLDTYDDRFTVGENLVIITGTTPNTIADWDSTIQTWFDENKFFTYPKLSSETRHYTQIVWADTEYIGCGFSAYREENTIDAFRAFYMCYYGPAGNVKNTAPYETE